MVQAAWLCSIISDMWNIRMRASKKLRTQNLKLKSENPKLETRNPKYSEIHISGAEGIYEDNEVSEIVGDYTVRALNHPRGRPDKIIITVEEVTQRPKMIDALPVCTLKCSSPSDAKEFIERLLSVSGISGVAIKTAFKVLSLKQAMRGASLVCAGSGRRVEPDRERGIRASRFGISGEADKSLSLRLSRNGINNITVKEAVILASKVASCKQILAEVCISDDPDYTTGYISSIKYGYVRIPDIKIKGDRKGGRVFFIKEDADINSAINFLERTPVIINRAKACSGTCPVYEIINRYHK